MCSPKRFSNTNFLLITGVGSMRVLRNDNDILKIYKLPHSPFTNK